MRCIDGRTKVYCVLGNPVAHSVSPVFQNRFFEGMGIDGIYVPFCIQSEAEMDHAMQGLRALGVQGINVTIPYKETVKLLMDDLDSSARMVGAVNTIRIDHGTLTGFNTDPSGFGKDYLRCTGKSLNGARILLLGAGGSARSVACECLRQGAEKVYIQNRSRKRAVLLVDHLSRYFSAGRIAVQEPFTRWNELDGNIPDLVINTTPFGMEGTGETSPAASFPLEGMWPGFTQGQAGYDLIYRPAVTPLMQSAFQKGCPAWSGLGMLVMQGAESFRIWTGMEVDPDLLDETIDELQVLLNGT